MLVWISPANLRTHAPRQRSGDTSPGPGRHMASSGKIEILLWNTRHMPIFRSLNGWRRWNTVKGHHSTEHVQQGPSTALLYLALSSSECATVPWALIWFFICRWCLNSPQQLFIHSELQNVCPEGYQCTSLWQWSHQQRSCSDFRRLNEHIRMYFVSWFRHVYISKMFENIVHAQEKYSIVM